MRIDILTLFPDRLQSVLTDSITGRAITDGRVDLRVTDIRRFAQDKHHTADDTPYGGGGGMVMLADVVARAVESVTTPEAQNIVLDPAGELFNQGVAAELSLAPHLVLVCGHYKGIDERVIGQLDLRPISIGDYVLTGGEPAAWVITDAVIRILPGVLGDFESAQGDSFFYEGLLGPAVYTRPSVWRGQPVPEALLSGNHEKIRAWRRESMLERTRRRRPDLWRTREAHEETAG